MEWHIKRFNELNVEMLYDILKLRVDVFVVEQRCFYAELDDLDRHENTIHLFCYRQKRLVSYLRIIPLGLSYKSAIAFGRVVVEPTMRGNKLGDALLTKALAVATKHYNGENIKISAQQHLLTYYQKHGFKQLSEMYLEDGIPHIEMFHQSNV